MMRKTKWILGLAALVLTAVAGMAGSPPFSALNAGEKSPSAAVIKIDNFSFGPSDVTVPVGTTITWTNQDDVPHVVASDDKIFKSKVLDTDERFSYTFAKPGTYLYYCSIHPKMTARVVVQ